MRSGEMRVSHPFDLLRTDDVEFPAPYVPATPHTGGETTLTKPEFRRLYEKYTGREMTQEELGECAASQLPQMMLVCLCMHPLRLVVRVARCLQTCSSTCWMPTGTASCSCARLRAFSSSTPTAAARGTRHPHGCKAQRQRALALGRRARHHRHLTPLVRGVARAPRLTCDSRCCPPHSDEFANSLKASGCVANCAMPMDEDR